MTKRGMKGMLRKRLRGRLKRLRKVSEWILGFCQKIEYVFVKFKK